MVDESDAAVEGDPRESTTGTAEAGAEEAEASVEVLGSPGKILRAHAASPSLSTASGAPPEASASGAVPAPTPRRSDTDAETDARALVARNRRASIAPPLWKVCSRPRLVSDPPRALREPRSG